MSSMSMHQNKKGNNVISSERACFKIFIVVSLKTIVSYCCSSLFVSCYSTCPIM